jgi:hypothetical protein
MPHGELLVEFHERLRKYFIREWGKFRATSLRLGSWLEEWIGKTCKPWKGGKRRGANSMLVKGRFMD